MRKSPFETLCSGGNKLLDNIAKSYQRGFSPETTLKHGNTIITLINEYTKAVRELTDDKIYGVEVSVNWPLVRGNSLTAFKRLRLQIEIPDPFPEVPFRYFTIDAIIGESASSVTSGESDSASNVENRVLDSVGSELNGSFTNALLAETPAKTNLIRNLLKPPLLNQSATVHIPQPPPFPPPVNHIGRRIVNENNFLDLIRARLERIREKMAENFLKLAATIVKDSYDGDPSKLVSFLDSLTLLNAHATDRMDVAMAFIKTRLVGDARDLITNEVTLTAVFNTLRAGIRVPTSGEITLKLAGLKHKEQSALEFSREVDSLGNMLKRSYISEGVSATSANQYATREVTKTLLASAPTSHAKAVLDAKVFNSPAEATAKYIELAKDTTASVLHFKNRQFGPRKNKKFNNRRYPRNDNNSYRRENRDRNDYRNDYRDRNDRRNFSRDNRSNFRRDRNVRVVNSNEGNDQGSPSRQIAGELMPRQ